MYRCSLCQTPREVDEGVSVDVSSAWECRHCGVVNTSEATR